jgi:hypothetical protein
MERVRRHLRTVSAVFGRRIQTGHTDLNAELIFLHLRKTLEEIAFSSLCANRDKYSEVRAKFASFWRAKDLLKEIGRINPNFYPTPVRFARQLLAEDGKKLSHFEAIGHEHLTQEDFVFLYTKASEVLHARNPYRDDDPTIDVRHTIPDWIARIQNLLTIHTTKLIENEEMWLVFVPEHGQIQANVSKLVSPEEYDPRLQVLSDQPESNTQDLGETVL